MNLHLSILDQSPIISGHTPARAVIGDFTSRLRFYELLAREFESQ